LSSDINSLSIHHALDNHPFLTQPIGLEPTSQRHLYGHRLDGVSHPLLPLLTTTIYTPKDLSLTSHSPIYADAGPVVNINHVMFTPGARTYWHTHEHGQMLRVLAGSGWVCDKGGEPRRLNVGDTVWCDAGTTHWHGGDDGSFMLHLAVSHGKTVWLDEVSDEEYRAKNK
jgi:quercetin dioxygenase-like cupin family protein